MKKAGSNRPAFSVAAAPEPVRKPGQQPGKTWLPAITWLPAFAWVLALGLVAVAVYLGWLVLRQPGGLLDRTSSAAITRLSTLTQGIDSPESVEGALAALPAFQATAAHPVIDRQADLHTDVPNRPDETVRQYTVAKGDSVFEIAARFKLKPESVLWANYELLNDNPDLISMDMQLNIPPVDGVLYAWKEGDTFDGVAARFETKPDEIVNFPGNQIDLVDPKVEPGTLLMVPGGKREYRQWIIPTIPRGRAGVSQAVYGGGACEGGYEGAYGSGAFIWPAGNHSLSGNDYWDGHLGIDIAAGEGAPVYAADSGVVVFSGWATGGYGYMVMIDHGNGYQTVYAHLSSVSAGCGRSVSQGSVIGSAGSTGNSTGAHLHFEVRYQGGFVNPWYVLPAP